MFDQVRQCQLRDKAGSRGPDHDVEKPRRRDIPGWEKNGTSHIALEHHRYEPLSFPSKTVAPPISRIKSSISRAALISMIIEAHSLVRTSCFVVIRFPDPAESRITHLPNWLCSGGTSGACRRAARLRRAAMYMSDAGTGSGNLSVTAPVVHYLLRVPIISQLPRTSGGASR